MALPTLPEGFVISSRYEVVSTLGAGGMGIVYKAHDRVLNETVALKVLRADLVESADAMQRFLAEIKLARSVSHRNVCRLHEYGMFGGLRYISMAFVDGVDLKRVIAKSGPCAPERGFEIAIQIVEGLEAIHAEGIIHRDLKTPNLMLDGRGVVRLMDFGIAKHSLETASAITGTGVIVGTPEYMSPEQVLGKKLDSRSDIYAFGIVLYELFTGQTPFQGKTPVATIMKQVQEAPPLDAAAAAGVPAPVVDVIARALAKDREARYPSATALLDDLRRARDAWRKTRADADQAARTAGVEPALPLGDTLDSTPHTTAREAVPTLPRGDEPDTLHPPSDVTVAEARPADLGTRPSRAPATPTAPSVATPAVLAGAAVFLLGLLGIAGGLWWWTRPAPTTEPPTVVVPSAPPEVATRTGILATAAPPAPSTAAPLTAPSPRVVTAPSAPPPTNTPGPERRVPSAAAPSAEVLGLIAEAEGAFAAQQYDAALAFYEETLKLDPANERARIGRDLCAKAIAAAPAAAAGRRTFAAGSTAYTPPVGKPAASGPAGFQPSGAVAVRRVDQPAGAAGALVFEVAPPEVRAGDPYTVRISLVNERAAPMALARAVVSTTVDGKTVSGPVPLATEHVAPLQRALVVVITDRWRAATSSWSMVATVETAQGETYRSELRWK